MKTKRAPGGREIDGKYAKNQRKSLKISKIPENCTKKGAKMSQRATKMHPKVDLRDQVEFDCPKRGSPPISFWSGVDLENHFFYPFGENSGKKHLRKIIQKTMPKKTGFSAQKLRK